MRHIRIPRRERIRKSEAVNIVDNTQPADDPYSSLLFHLEHVKNIISEGVLVFNTKDVAVIKRSIATIERKIEQYEEE